MVDPTNLVAGRPVCFSFDVSFLVVFYVSCSAASPTTTAPTTLAVGTYGRRRRRWRPQLRRSRRRPRSTRDAPVVAATVPSRLSISLVDVCVAVVRDRHGIVGVGRGCGTHAGGWRQRSCGGGRRLSGAPCRLAASGGDGGGQVSVMAARRCL
ncbi:hypothetical protein I4F81_005703 [Pyropia yezoensis]|uniref:Uncharacterized protein n=1 Tax=Pyropia yezoensis TaxID=2788 RepID=A0ACC3BZP5_PYRYE|nr:hypothetical protein I4F81_005703 [Neopyropia yezoensis]